MTVPGLRIGRYEVGERLGKGGFGVVHLARDTELGRDVAIKFLRPEFLTRPEIAQRFLQEARAAAKIGHPGIVTVLECGLVTGTGHRVDGTAYIVMEKLAGQRLTDRLDEKGHLEPAVAIAIGRQLASALQAAHDASIIHRDLKPDNVFLIRDPAVVGGERVKIVDFGVAKLLEPDDAGVHTNSQIMLGTPRYMAPEQTRSPTRVDQRSDIYALGCMLYELVCGRPPFTGTDVGDLVVKHQSATAMPPREIIATIPPDLDRLIVRMLAKNPDDRPSSMTEVDTALAAVKLASPRAVSEPTETVTKIFGRESVAPIPPVEPPTADELPTVKFEPKAAPSAPMNVVEVPTPAPVRRTRSVLVVVAALGAAVLGGLVTAMALRGDSEPRSTQAGKEPVAHVAEQPDANVEPVADAALVAETSDAPAEPSSDGERDTARVRAGCRQFVVDKRWTEAVTCADELAKLDPAVAKEIKDRGTSEMKAEAAFRGLTDALTGKSLKTARTTLASIPRTSVYFKEAMELLAKAELAAIEGSVAELTQIGNRNSCKDFNIRLRQTEQMYGKSTADDVRRRVKCPTGGATAVAACDFEAAEAKGNANVANGNHAAALAAYEQALTCKSDGAVLQKAFLAACNAKIVAKARQLYANLPADKQTYFAQACSRYGIDPAKHGCDFDDAVSRGDKEVTNGNHAAALTAYKEALVCKPDGPVLRKAFLAACNSKNLRDAKALFKKLATDKQNYFAQACLRYGIDPN